MNLDYVQRTKIKAGLLRDVMMTFSDGTMTVRGRYMQQLPDQRIRDAQ